MPVSELHLLVEQRVCGVEISDLPCLSSGHNSNLTSEDMNVIRHQGIDANGNPYPQKKHIPGNTPLTQLVEDNSWISEGNI